MSRFDFQDYVESQKEPKERARALRFTDYAFKHDIKQLRTLDGLPPVRVLIGATQQLWSGWGRGAVLKASTKISEKEGGRLYRLLKEAAQTLHLPPLPAHLTPHLKEVQVAALGDRNEQFLAVHTAAPRSLDDATLRFLIGRALGQVQNGHVPFLTAAYYSEEIAGLVARWATRPATLALFRWRKHATLTADRAGLLVCGALDVAIREIVEEALSHRRREEDISVDKVVAALDGDHSEDPHLKILKEASSEALSRIEALRLFARSKLFLEVIGRGHEPGLSMTEVDDRVDAMLRGQERSPDRARE